MEKDKKWNDPSSTVKDDQELVKFSIKRLLSCDDATAEKMRDWHLKQLNHVLSVRFDYWSEKKLVDEINTLKQKIAQLEGGAETDHVVLEAGIITDDEMTEACTVVPLTAK